MTKQMHRLAPVFFILFAGLSFVGMSKKPESSSATSSTESVWVQQRDGAKSCEQGSGVAPEAGAESLKRAGVQVLEARKGHDGKMHLQMCGAETGSVNLYRIPAKDLEAALKAGFSAASNPKTP